MDFFNIFFIFSFFTGNTEITIKKIIESYILYGGIGYVWIIRIYFIVAMIIPIYNYYSSKYNSKLIISVVMLLYIIYEFLFYIGMFDNSIIEYLFAYFIPCLLLVAISKNMFENDKNKTIAIISLVLFIFESIIIYKLEGDLVSTQGFKYPFRSYYLIYGIFFSNILIIIFKGKKISEILYNKYVSFIASNSLWIYLWHILILYCLREIELVWYFKFIIVLIFSCIITYIQHLIIKLLNGKVSDNILSLFLG